MTYISGMRTGPIRTETYYILPILITFTQTLSPIPTSQIVSHHLVGMMMTASSSDAFPTDAVQFEDAKVSQSDDNDFFTLCLCTSVKVSLMVI
jgi:hypothetical protein